MRRLNNLLAYSSLGRIGGYFDGNSFLSKDKIGFYDPYIPNGYEKVYAIGAFYISSF